MATKKGITDFYLLNGVIITPSQVLENSGIYIKGKYIEEIFNMDDYQIPEGSNVIDVEGAIITPGFIDIHLHGGGGADVMDGTVQSYKKISEVHARAGTTSLLPTTLTSSDEDLLKTLEVFSQVKQENYQGAKLLGMHLEGPYFANAQRGAQDPEYIKCPDREQYMSILENNKDILRVSAAPELPGGLELGRELRRRGILASIGHSDATYKEVLKAIDAGYTHVTHLYSGMSGVKRVNCYRVAGIIETGLLIDDLTVEIIADGKHLPASLLQLIYKNKGSNNIALCSDAISAAGMPEGEYLLGGENGQKILVEEGVAWLADKSAFAGSVSTGITLIKTMVELAKVSMEEAVKMM